MPYFASNAAVLKSSKRFPQSGANKKSPMIPTAAIIKKMETKSHPLLNTLPSGVHEGAPDVRMAKAMQSWPSIATKLKTP